MTTENDKRLVGGRRPLVWLTCTRFRADLSVDRNRLPPVIHHAPNRTASHKQAKKNSSWRWMLARIVNDHRRPPPGEITVVVVVEATAGAAPATATSGCWTITGMAGVACGVTTTGCWGGATTVATTAGGCCCKTTGAAVITTAWGAVGPAAKGERG